jgi:hypothetical protein
MAKPSADSKVSIEDAVQHISSTLAQHADALRHLKDTMKSIQPPLVSREETLHSQNREEIRLLETNLTAQVSENMQSLNTDLREIKAFLTSRSETVLPPHDNLSPRLNTQTTDPSVHRPSQLPIDSDASVSYTSQHHILQPNHTIVVPPPSSIPTFSDKSTERPRQFLIRVEEYARTVNHWSKETFLRGISQFLRDNAFEWYCQLHHQNSLPIRWDQFVIRFLAQFHSPIRAAQQEQAWTECKQHEDETINQFVVRLRSLWLEQKPDEAESDFTKHLFCKMRPDMLTLMNFSRTSSLDAIILEAQKIEEILYLRNKEQRQCELLKLKHTLFCSSQN